MPVSAASAPASTVAVRRSIRCGHDAGEEKERGRAEKRTGGDLLDAMDTAASPPCVALRAVSLSGHPPPSSPSSCCGHRRSPPTARPLLHGTLHHPGSLDLAVVLNPLALLTLSSHLSRRSSPTLSFSWRALADTSLWTQTDHPSHGQTEATLLEETATVADAEQLVRWPSSSLYPKYMNLLHCHVKGFALMLIMVH